MRSLILVCLAMSSLAGCFPTEEPLITQDLTARGPFFCDVEEPRRFSQAEIDWRAANAPWNLRRDFKTNETWDAECVSADERSE